MYACVGICITHMFVCVCVWCSWWAGTEDWWLRMEASPVIWLEAVFVLSPWGLWRWGSVCICVCVCECVCVCVCASARLRARACLCLCTYVRVCLSVGLHSWVLVCCCCAPSRRARMLRQGMNYWNIRELAVRSEEPLTSMTHTHTVKYNPVSPQPIHHVHIYSTEERLNTSPSDTSATPWLPNEVKKGLMT